MSAIEIREKIPTVISFVIIFIFGFVILVFVIDITQIEEKQIQKKIINPIEIAENYIQNGDLYAALDAFTHMINEDPTDEYSWHQKGKLLNRLQLCDDAQFHYSEYLDHFPNSLRGQEGFQIALNC